MPSRRQEDFIAVTHFSLIPELKRSKAEQQARRRETALLLVRSTQSFVQSDMHLLLILWLLWADGEPERHERLHRLAADCQAAVLDGLQELDKLRTKYEDIPEARDAARIDRDELLHSAYARARVSVARNRVSRNRKMLLAGLPLTCPWSWAQICDRKFEPDAENSVQR